MFKFFSSPESTYKRSGRQIRRINKKLEDSFMSKKREEKLKEKKARAIDNRKVAEFQLKQPNSSKTKSTIKANFGNTTNNKNVGVHFHFNKKK